MGRVLVDYPDDGSSSKIRIVGKFAARSAFCFRAARWSVWLPVIATLLLLGINKALEGRSDPTAAWQRASTLQAFGGLLVLSIGLGLLALVGVRRHGARGLLWRGLRGICVSLVLLGYLGKDLDGVAKVRQALLGVAKVRQVLLALRSKAKAATPQNEQTVPEPASATGPVKVAASDKAAPDAPARPLSADELLIMKATTAHAQKLQALTDDYTAAENALRSPPVLSLAGLTKREQVLARKALVKKFLATNDKLEAFLANDEELFGRDLNNAQYPQAKTRSALESYARSNREKTLLALKLRQAGERRGEALIGILDVLDSAFGKWRFDPQTGKLLFDDNNALGHYLAFRRSLDSASAEQEKLQGQLMMIARN